MLAGAGVPAWAEIFQQGASVDAARAEAADAALARATALGVSYADIRVNRYRRESIATRERQVQNVSRSASYGLGLLISRFWYVRLVDPRTIALTGLTRDGLWWIENGEVRHPVRNLRFNQSVLAMLAPWNVEAIGPSQRLSPFMVPPLKLAAFTFTSMSDAI